MNAGASWPGLVQAELRVLSIQAKLHQWSIDDAGHRFDDLLLNLVTDPAFLIVAWDRVRGNRGARSAGIDAVSPRSMVLGSKRLLSDLRDDLRSRQFRPLPVRQAMIPKANCRRP